ncbi:MAG: ribonuclease R, partial [Alcanivorax sp.]
GRSATGRAERWLASIFLVQQAQEASRIFRGNIVHVNSSGFNVKLDDSGLEGFVDLRKDPEKFSYDKWTASLTSTTRRFQLEQTVELAFTNVNEEQNFQVLFALRPGCGLKAQKESDQTTAGAAVGKDNS